jgi:hypothetical protein
MISKAELKEYIELHLVNVLDDRFSVRVTASYNVYIYIYVLSSDGDIDFDLILQIVDIIKYLKNILRLNFKFEINSQRNTVSFFEYKNSGIIIRFNVSENSPIS